MQEIGLVRWLSTARNIGIPLVNGELADETAAAIRRFPALQNGDSIELIEDERTAWLALYEGARLAVEHRLALTLAGEHDSQLTIQTIAQMCVFLRRH